jgi:hypothetical protein
MTHVTQVTRARHMSHATCHTSHVTRHKTTSQQVTIGHRQPPTPPYHRRLTVLVLGGARSLSTVSCAVRVSTRSRRRFTCRVIIGSQHVLICSQVRKGVDPQSVFSMVPRRYSARQNGGIAVPLPKRAPGPRRPLPGHWGGQSPQGEGAGSADAPPPTPASCSASTHGGRGRYGGPSVTSVHVFYKKKSTDRDLVGRRGEVSRALDWATVMGWSSIALSNKSLHNDNGHSLLTPSQSLCQYLAIIFISRSMGVL